MKTAKKENTFLETVADGQDMVCRGCGTKQNVKLPLPVDQFLDVVQGFSRRHQACKRIFVAMTKEPSDEEKTKIAIAMRDEILALAQKYERRDWLDFAVSSLHDAADEIDDTMDEIADVE